MRFGGPEALGQREVVAIYERLLGRTIATEDMPRAEIEAMFDGPRRPPSSRSRACCSRPRSRAAREWPGFEDTFDIRRTSVADFAAAHTDLKGNR